jgi:hypothetical protein
MAPTPYSPNTFKRQLSIPTRRVYAPSHFQSLQRGVSLPSWNPATDMSARFRHIFRRPSTHPYCYSLKRVFIQANIANTQHKVKRGTLQSYHCQQLFHNYTLADTPWEKKY